MVQNSSQRRSVFILLQCFSSPLFSNSGQFPLLWANLHTNPGQALCRVSIFTYVLMQSDTESPPPHPPPHLSQHTRTCTPPLDCQPLTPEGQWQHTAAWNKYTCSINSSWLAECVCEALVSLYDTLKWCQGLFCHFYLVVVDSVTPYFTSHVYTQNPQNF